MVIARYLGARIRADLARKMVLLTGPRQAGKTTLARAIMESHPTAQYLNWDVPGDRRIVMEQTWSARADLLVFDEIHKMREWKAFLNGTWDGRPKDQSILVTGSARMETFRQTGASLAGRYFALRLHPFSVRELCECAGFAPGPALDRLLLRGGFPEPCLAVGDDDAARWRNQYATDLVREDVLEFSRVHELRVMRMLLEMLRERVGSSVKLASLAQELQISPTTVARYVEILEALYVVFSVRPFHRNIARAILKEAKIYFFDTGLVAGDEAARFENACAVMLLKHAHYLQDTAGRAVTLHYVRDKQHHEVDFALVENSSPLQFVECKHSGNTPSAFLHQLAERFPMSQAVQIVRELRQEEQRGRVAVREAAGWLRELAA